MGKKLTFKNNELFQQSKKIDENLKNYKSSIGNTFLDYNYELGLNSLSNQANSISKEMSFIDKLYDLFLKNNHINTTLRNTKNGIKDIDISSKRNSYNKAFIDNKKIELSNFFKDIEGKSLDKQQQEAIIKDEINNLIVAGAGSGKTTTIVGKLKYLIEHLHYHPNDILVISFTNNSAKELQERIDKYVDKNISISTFHKLGINIIEEINKKKPKIASAQMSKYIHDIFYNLLEDIEFKKKILRLFY